MRKGNGDIKRIVNDVYRAGGDGKVDSGVVAIDNESVVSLAEYQPFKLIRDSFLNTMSARCYSRMIITLRIKAV